jgi:hypothetical protein
MSRKYADQQFPALPTVPHVSMPCHELLSDVEVAAFNRFVPLLAVEFECVVTLPMIKMLVPSVRFVLLLAWVKLMLTVDEESTVRLYAVPLFGPAVLHDALLSFVFGSCVEKVMPVVRQFEADMDT